MKGSYSCLACAAMSPEKNNTSDADMSYSQYVDSRAILRMDIGFHVGIMLGPVLKSLWSLYRIHALLVGQ